MSGYHRAPAAGLAVLVLLASATAFGPEPSPSCAAGVSCTQTPDYYGPSTAISLNGYGAKASGAAATAMGGNTAASGPKSVAMGYGTNASGYGSVAMGDSTTASGEFSLAMGRLIEASADNSLVNSGEIHGKYLAFVADQRLVTDIQPVNSATLLEAVTSLKVVTHTPSPSLCAHQNLTAAECAGSRTVGLLAQQVAPVLPGAVRSVSSLTLATPEAPPRRRDALYRSREEEAKPAREVLEHVKDVQALDVHTLLAHLIGAVQAQSDQIENLKQENKKQSEQIGKQSEENKKQSGENKEQSGQIAAYGKSN